MTGILASSRVRRSTRNLLLITTSTSSSWKINSALFNHNVDYQYVDNTNGNVLYSGSAADLGFEVDLSIGNGDTSLFILDRELGYDIDELDLRVLLLNAINVNFLPSLLSLNIDTNNVTVLDITKNTNLTGLRFESNDISVLDVTQHINLTGLSIARNNISVLDVTQNINLTGLSCFSNNISVLDVTQNTNLTALDCGDNPFSVLDLSQNTALSFLVNSLGNISVLDLSQNTALSFFKCIGNTLTSLNFKNGNNTNILTFNITNNPDLECVLVDDVAYANENFTSKDAHTNYSDTTCP